MKLPRSNEFQKQTDKEKPALLALASGEIFWGVSMGFDNTVVGEIIFNTAMTGYQEVLTDPSYANQLVAFTYPHIGNVGINEEDAESSRVWPLGLILREKLSLPSNYRAQQSLREFCIKNKVPCISGIDTRHLTHLIREKGLQKACLMAGVSIDANHAVTLAQSFLEQDRTHLVNLVSTAHIYQWQQGSWVIPNGVLPHSNQHQSEQYQVVVYDFGVKRSILRKFADLGCKVIVVPANTSVDEVLTFNPHGIVFSNGPGDPRIYSELIEKIKRLLQMHVPLLGICLGHQLLALACGAQITKMRFGHHGANHPVQCLETKKVTITSQNHCFAVEETTLPEILYVTHRSLFDNSLQGFRLVEKPVIGFQGHPEGGPGPSDMAVLYDQFLSMMFQYKMQNHFPSASGSS